VTTFRSDDEIDSTLLIAGCDPAAAMIADFLVRRRSPIAAAVISCSSRQSLKNLTEGTVHAAGIHLRDPKTGEYNRMPRAIGRPTRLVNFARWELGLAAAPGNPHRIREISDLARPGVRIVNREPGAGARTALDEELAAAGIKCRAIHGYDRIVRGHLEVAAAIASGTADAGITIRVAADAYRLVFVPIREERYDLLVADQDADAEPIKALFDVLGSSRFAREIAELCSYDTSQMGKVMDAVN
jgi:molybdate-binding protein